MSIETLIRSWKDPEFRTTLGANRVQHPAGDHLVELDEAMLQSVVGASSGWICTLSGECNTSGCSCWNVLSNTTADCRCVRQ